MLKKVCGNYSLFCVEKWRMLGGKTWPQLVYLSQTAWPQVKYKTNVHMDCSLKNALSCPWRLSPQVSTQKKNAAINMKLPTFSLLQKGFSTYAKIWKLDLFHSYNLECFKALFLKNHFHFSFSIQLRAKRAMIHYKIVKNSEITEKMARWCLCIMFSICPIFDDFFMTKPFRIPISLRKHCLK